MDLTSLRGSLMRPTKQRKGLAGKLRAPVHCVMCFLSSVVQTHSTGSFHQTQHHIVVSPHMTCFQHHFHRKRSGDLDLERARSIFAGKCWVNRTDQTAKPALHLCSNEIRCSHENLCSEAHANLKCTHSGYDKHVCPSFRTACKCT